MNLTRVSELMGGKLKLSKALAVSPGLVTHWGDKVPKAYIKATKQALRKRKRELDKAYNEVMKGER